MEKQRSESKSGINNGKRGTSSGPSGSDGLS
jgi:hypothetical protein